MKRKTIYQTEKKDKRTKEEDRGEGRRSRGAGAGAGGGGGGGGGGAGRGGERPGLFPQAEGLSFLFWGVNN